MSPSKVENANAAHNKASVVLDYYLKSELEIQSAVSLITKPVSDLTNKELAEESTLEDALEGLWSAILDKVRTASYDDTTQDRIVWLLKAIKSLSPPIQPAPQIWGLSLWTDLPLLGAAIREAWNNDIDAEQWVNLNAFAATLTASHVLDLSLYAIWTMRDALETPVLDIPSGKLDQRLQAAAIWILHCGRRLKEADGIWETDDPKKGDPARGGRLYGGPKGFCEQRWEFWSERVRELSVSDGVGGKTMNMLGEAAGVMDALRGFWG